MLCSVQPVAAQVPPVFQGGETVVTAGRIPQKLSDTLRDVVVITARDIDNSGQLTLGQVLQLLGGVEMASNGGPGSSSSVFIRGANSAHTLVLVDGIRLQSATTGTTAFENIPLAEIERIEIVPGPVSGLYGSDAIGGVIQVFTKSGRYSPGPSAAASIGSYGYGSATASFSGAANDTAYAITGGWTRTTGFSATKPGVPFGQYNPDNDGFRNSNFSAKLNHRFVPGQEIGASVLYSKGVTHFDSGPIGDPRTEQTLATYSMHSRNQITQSWESLLRIGASRDDSSTLETAYPGEFRTDQLQAQWQNNVRLGTTTLLGGLEYLRQKIDTSTPFPVDERTVRSAFAGATGDYGNHAVQVDVRRDDNSQFGTPTSGSAAYAYRFTPEFKLRAAYGKAFHAPTFNDLYYPGFGNPQLRPERSRNREIGFDYSARAQRLSATFFENRITDLIVFSFDPDTSAYLPSNVARATIRGVQLAYSARWGDTQVKALLTVQDPKSDTTGFLLQRRAKEHGSVIARRSFGPWTFGAEILASGARFDSANESSASRLHGYTVVNLTGARRISNDWSVELRWNNVGDTDYELVRGYATPGSNVLLTVKWSPKT